MGEEEGRAPGEREERLSVEELMEIVKDRNARLWRDVKKNLIRIRLPSGRSISIPYEEEVYLRLKEARDEALGRKGTATTVARAVVSDIALWNTFIAKRRPLIEELIARVSWFQSAVLDIGANVVLLSFLIGEPEEPERIPEILADIKDKDKFVGFVMEKILTVYQAAKGVDEIARLRERVRMLEAENAVMKMALDRLRVTAADLRRKLDIALATMSAPELRTFAKVRPEEARSLLAPLLSKKDRLEEFKRMLDDIGSAAKVLEGLPDDVRPVVAGALVRDVLGNADAGDDMKALVREASAAAAKVAIISSVMNAAFANVGQGREEPKEVAELRELVKRQSEQIDRLMAELEKLREEKREREAKAIRKTIVRLYKAVKSLNDRIGDVESRIMEAASRGGGEGGKGVVDALDALKEIGDKINSAAESLKKLGYLVMSPEEMVRSARSSADKEYDIKKVSAEAYSKVLKEDIGPALAELIKNPKKIVEFVDALRNLVGGRSAMEEAYGKAGEAGKARTSATSRGPPRIEEYAKGGGSGGRGGS